MIEVAGSRIEYLYIILLKDTICGDSFWGRGWVSLAWTAAAPPVGLCDDHCQSEGPPPLNWEHSSNWMWYFYCWLWWNVRLVRWVMVRKMCQPQSRMLVWGGGWGVGPARQSGTSRGGQQSWIFLITPASSVYTQPYPATRRRTTSFVLLELDHHSQRGSLKICSTLFMECLFLECFVKICYGSSLHLLGVWPF